MGVTPSWKVNAAGWIRAIEQSELANRELVTSRAILEAIQQLNPSTLLDMGCGEGWLVRILRSQGVAADGLDRTLEYIHCATAKDCTEHYFLLSYEEVLAGRLNKRSYDAIVFNFSLLEKELTEKLLAYLPSLLNHKGHLLIQTLHPFRWNFNQPYQSHWESQFDETLPALLRITPPWYARTISDWIHLVLNSGFQLVRIEEPLCLVTQQPISLLLVAQKHCQGNVA
ncbi:MAG: methyltransferase domain-containing protein [Cytophagales bacterium]|nr:class I SAM-dependent methyltransferase [Bernardetiaceae bacterium]MDW8210669.1 methyltransferase domain-containing protein [Cytophagales bacterium]